MATTGLDVFDKTLQTTNIWLDEIMEVIGPDRQVAWHVLGAVLRTLHDRLPWGSQHISVHSFRFWCAAFITTSGNRRSSPTRTRSLDEFLKQISEKLENIRPVNVEDGTRAVFHVLSRHLDRGQAVKVHDALPEQIRRRLWPDNFLEEAPSRQQAARD